MVNKTVAYHITSKSAKSLVRVNGKFSLDMCSWSKSDKSGIHKLALSWKKYIFH
jgi:hypothetical protein